MAIKYTQVLNSFVSTEGSNGIMTNYIYYSVLVVYTDQPAEIVEGKNHEIAYLLKYLRTPVDELTDIKDTVKGLRQDINDVVDEKMKYVVDSLFPLPDIQNKNEVEALNLLKDAGLIPVLENTYPEGTPANGIVRRFHRNEDNFKKVNVLIIHDVPKVEKLHESEALLKLKEAGFTAEVIHKAVTGSENGTVLRCSRADENKLLVSLEVASTIPETKGMAFEEARKLLEDQGYDVVIEKKVDTCIPGIVTGWAGVTEKKIMLYVSIPEKYNSKFVDVQWTNMQDSTGDTYGAVAEFNNQSHELLLKVSYTLGAKSKHQIVGIEHKTPSAGQQAPRIGTGWTMEPNTKGSLNIILPFGGKPFERIPNSFSLSLDTQYGLLKKKDTVSLQFTIDWW